VKEMCVLGQSGRIKAWGGAAKKSFGNHALYFGYKGDQRPFFTRIVMEKHKN